MNRFFIFLMLMIIPSMVFADMVGYSGDKRRYVTEDEKSQFPYNTVVRFDDKGNPGTGTFVSKDIMLTCRHVVDDTGAENFIDYYTSDGKKHTGYVANYIKDYKSTHDFAWVIDENAFSGQVLNIAPETKYSNNLMVIGYDSLKPLSDDEIKILKQLYAKWIQDNGRVTSYNAYKAMAEISAEAIMNHSCSSLEQKDCIRCSQDSDIWCLFGDSTNMKVRTGCKITAVKDMIYTDCPGAPGASGSAVIDINSGQIIGILCEIGKPQIGQDKDAMSLAVRPEIYYKSLNTWIEGLKNIE